MSHSNDIQTFIEIFCSLPEVVSVVIDGIDNVGINRKFFDFLDSLNEIIKTNNKFKNYSSEE